MPKKSINPIFKRMLILLITVLGVIFLLIWAYFNYSFFSHNTGYLDDFVLVDGPISITNIKQQSSGLAYNSDKNLLYLITNNPTQIHVLSTKGKHIQKVDLQGFEDTEGITYLGNSRFAIISERKGEISWFNGLLRIPSSQILIIRGMPKKCLGALYVAFQALIIIMKPNIYLFSADVLTVS